MKKSVAVFGSTGSIGKNALEVIWQHPEKYQIKALVAGSDYKTLAKQCKKFQPEFAGINDKKHFKELKELLKDFPKIKIVAGSEAINDLAKTKFDFFLSAIVGIAALIPTLNAIKAGSNIGMANKECLVAAGHLMLKQAQESGSQILPIDSEHNAIFQILDQQNLDKIERIILTASGGPFLKFTEEQMKNITISQAIKHPNWKMGAKISIDSATMMNKTLEVIEAYHLFNINKDQIEILIHPESIIHGLVHYADGSILSMMSLPSMQVPIANALAYPKRISIKHQKLDLANIGKLHFSHPNEKKFPAIKLLKTVLKQEGNAPCVFNCANEVAVEKFLKGQIAFKDIVKTVDKTLNKIPFNQIKTIDDVILCDKKVRDFLLQN